MLGVVITFFSTLFDEITSSITKIKLEKKEISLYSIAVISYSALVIVFLVMNIFSRRFIFSLASWPTLTIRTILEIILSYIALIAVSKTDRSTFGFIRVLTIPLLLFVDFSLGYEINSYQLAGIGLIIFSLLFVFSCGRIKKQGALLTLTTAVLAVITISLYKYDITHYNSVAAEQVIVYAVNLSFFILMAFFKAKENPFAFFKLKIYRWQFLLNAIPGLLNSYAYVFAPASVILSAYRSSSVFWSVVSGKAYFQEENLLIKVLCLILLTCGIILLAI